MFRRLVSFCCVGTCLIASAAINLTSLNENGIDNWEQEVLSGESTYSLLKYKGRVALKATSENSASGLVLREQIDLLENPYLNWSWLAEKRLPSIDEHSKEGDDYVARVYVVIEGGFMIWRTKSLSYVWSSNQSKDQVWDNAFAGSNVKMIHGSWRGRSNRTVVRRKAQRVPRPD